MTRVTALLLTAASALPLATLIAAAQTPETPLTVETWLANPLRMHMVPAWSLDGKRLTYLDAGRLMDVDPATGTAHVLLRADEVSLDKGRGSVKDRDSGSSLKIDNYLWAPDSVHLLFDVDGQLWLHDVCDGTNVKVGSKGMAAGGDLKLSPDGTAITFLRDHGLAAIRLSEKGAPPESLTPAHDSQNPNRPTVLNGEVDWVYGEELSVTSNYFWAPDSRRVAYLQMDETQVPEYPLVDLIQVNTPIEWQRYPKPGNVNPAVRVGVVSAKGGTTTWMNVPLRSGDDYIPRFGWVDNKTVWVETLTRDHKRRTVFFADAEKGDSREMLAVTDNKFLDGNYDVKVGDGAIVLTNWSDGHNHLYLYSYDGKKPLQADAKLEKQLTRGDFEVGDILRVDVGRKVVDYASNEGNPLEQQIWQVNFGGERRQLSKRAGTHEAVFSPDGSAFADESSTVTTWIVEQICQTEKADASAKAETCRTFWRPDRLPYRLQTPEQIQVKAHDDTTLYAMLILPEGADSPATVRLIVNPYGGPGVQSVSNRLSFIFLFNEVLAGHGFAVLMTDNRGMAGRGRAFAQAAYHDLGKVQLEDQLTVIDAVLEKYPQLDPKRIGIWGGSFGGTLTLFAMTHSDRFRAGAADSPVTDWRNYDSIYTERYLGLPSEDAEAYRYMSAVNSAANLKGRLLLTSVTGDPNVHMANTVQLVEKLVEAGIPHDQQIYPGTSHSGSFQPGVIAHFLNRIVAHF
jgi:dipeptidyl-peptidase 4